MPQMTLVPSGQDPLQNLKPYQPNWQRWLTLGWIGLLILSSLFACGGMLVRPAPTATPTVRIATASPTATQTATPSKTPTIWTATPIPNWTATPELAAASPTSDQLQYLLGTIQAQPTATARVIVQTAIVTRMVNQAPAVTIIPYPVAGPTQIVREIITQTRVVTEIVYIEITATPAPPTPSPTPTETLAPTETPTPSPTPTDGPPACPHGYSCIFSTWTPTPSPTPTETPAPTQTPAPDSVAGYTISPNAWAVLVGFIQLLLGMAQ